MKPWLAFLSFSLLACVATPQKEAAVVKNGNAKNPKHGRINGYDLFYNLSRADALKKGRALAQEHFKRGELRFLVYGLAEKGGAGNAFEKHLQSTYGVLTSPIAGCLVSEGIVGAAEGYNKTMRQLLTTHFGRDVFIESWKASR